MTLGLSIQGPETIWLLADRRLSYEKKAPKDDARKIMFPEATDGVAILGYAGLGATALGTEAADWMSAVLRGRKHPLEQCLGILADAIKKQLPGHMLFMPKGSAAHTVVIPAFVEGDLRLYTIDIVLAPDGKFHFRWTKHVSNVPLGSQLPPRIALGGSGGVYLGCYIRVWTHNLIQ